jgi:cellobiose phosphorylase
MNKPAQRLKSILAAAGRVPLRPFASNGNGRSYSQRAEEPPLRAELFSVNQLEQHAKTLAGLHAVGPGRSPDRLLSRLSDNEAVLGRTYELVTDAVKRGRRITPAAEWFLDNYHLIEEQIRTARRHLPRGYSRELPRLINGPSAGQPRVYDIALELISHVDGQLDAQSLSAFVGSYQSVTSLRLGELWAIPIMLRLALLENLRRVALRVAEGRRDREQAAYWVERMVEVAATEPAHVVVVLGDMVKQGPPLNSAFASEFASRLHGRTSAMIFPMTWLEHRLAEQGQTLEQIFQDASQNQAADQVSIGNSITSLRLLGAIEWRDFVESLSSVEHVLQTDPADVYSAMDFHTRDRYRHAVEEIAKAGRLQEEKVAQTAVDLARLQLANDDSSRTAHVGYYLVGEGRAELERTSAVRPSLLRWFKRQSSHFPLLIYAGSIVMLTAAVTGLLLWWAARHGLSRSYIPACAVVLLLCVSQLVVALVHWTTMLIVRPRLLPRMDFSEGIPAENSTIVAVPTMLGDEHDIDEQIEALEIRFLANRDKNLLFALLSDFGDAPQQTLPTDEALLKRAREGIESLNSKWDNEDSTGAGFFLLHRARRWNPSEGVWMGWERKRGKLEDLNATLRGAEKKFDVVVGPVDRLTAVRYVITLDSDTQLPRESARELVGTMAHPLNRPHFDPKLGRVTEGYSILQPRVGITMIGAGRSRYASLFAGEPGIDPYTRAVSDVYQDVFEEGSFIGKGIYDVDAITQSIGGRFPENRVLSHDLLEGAHARSGLVSDVVLFEEHPATYTADIGRRHRWIRGDWQVASWLFPRVPGSDARAIPNPISGLSRWKILDNIRRSLVSPAMLTLLVLGWFLPGGAIFYTAIVLGLLLIPPLLTAATELLRRPADLPLLRHFNHVRRSIGRRLLQEAFSLACLPYDAWISLDAIVRTTVRLFVTRRRLLEWQTARDAQRHARNHLSGFFLTMWVAPATAAVLWLILSLLHDSAIPVAGTILTLWLVSPLVAWWISQPITAPTPRLSQDDVQFLRSIARRTWRFFEVFVTAAENYLPPDNVQEDPPRGAAHRTSPTNIGLSMLANLTAWDLGFICTADLLERTTQTLGTMDRLQRHHGHLYNWYDTVSLEPLRPLYVSTVDSGNLVGHLLILNAGLSALIEQRIFPPAALVGLGDTLSTLLERSGKPATPEIERLVQRLRTPPTTLTASYVLLKQFNSTTSALRTGVNGSDKELVWWAQSLEEQGRRFMQELSYVAPWLDLPVPADALWKTGNAEQIGHLEKLREMLRRLDDVPTLADAAQLEITFAAVIDQIPSDSLADWIKQLRAALATASEHAADRIKEIQQLAIRCREFADVDYEFLYDRQRHLLSIGYNVAEHRLDAGFYDLLASEARLGSFVAIAQGKLPQEHWFSFGRLLTWTSSGPVLLSWSGSIFEYLMPLLVMPTYDNTLLDQTYRAVVARQIEYGRERGVPWGISESGYAKTDAQLNYQYQAFGVPGLGFKRGLAEDLVIAPYATAMALMVDPQAACANLRRLREEERLGDYGFYEAVDYTPSRLPSDQTSVTIKSFMAHHHGMSLLSLSYVLLNRPMQRRFESDPAFRATELLLQERVPKTPPIYPHPAEVSEARGLAGDAGPNFRVYRSPHTPVPETHLLSNGRYHVMVTAAGGGYSRWRDLAVTRWQEDATRDHWGTFCYVRDVAHGEFWSTAHQPTLKPADSYEAIYSQGRAEFRRQDGDIHTHVQISVSPEDDVEVRRITINNRGREPRTIELTSYAEIVLAPMAADASHPAFSNLFVQTQLVRDRHAILATRRPRSASEKPPWMFHLMTVPESTNVSYATSRSQFIGRTRSVAYPAAMHRGTLDDSQGAVLDPIVSIRSVHTIGPDETVQVHLVSGIAETNETAMSLIEKYHDPRLADRVFELAWTHSQVILRQLDAVEADVQLYCRLANSMLYTNRTLRASASTIARNRQGQSGLWSYGISGDLPILLLRVASQSQIDLVQHLIQAHAYWRAKGLITDLVIWNEDQTGYRQALHEQIMGIITSRAEQNLLDKPGGIFVRRVEQMSEEDRILMQTVARLVISDTAGTLAEQLDRRMQPELAPPRLRPSGARRADPAIDEEISRRGLSAFNGIGGFTPDGREYVIDITDKSPTPAPWCNVIANPNFGTVITESGGAYTWCENANSFRLTPWYNDPVADSSGEAFYIRDEETGRFWSPTPLPARGRSRYVARHGFGYSIFEYSEGGLQSEMAVYVAIDGPVKFITFKLRNTSGRQRRISVTGFFELVLGDRRSSNLPYIVTEIDPKTGALLARNAYNNEFAGRTIFLDVSEMQRTVSGDRLEFIGRNGTPANPAAMQRVRLSGRVGAALDPCAAMQVMLDLPDRQTREITFTFGCGRDQNDARNLVARFRGNANARRAIEGVWDYWNKTLSTVVVQTPDQSINFLANGWLPYQILSCRMWGRSGFYQSGGAFGFRDQLQDSMALVHAAPALMREQLLRAAARQFREGDVQHWWHPPQGRGVRTRISDDYLWLPYATCRYVAAIGDTGVLDEKTQFLEGRPVNADEDSYYDMPVRSEQSATLYEHCVLAIKHGLRFGEHGLPLMGCGDWNDGMNLVGEHNKGESVWLAFFLYDVLMQFSALAARRQDTSIVDLCTQEAAKLRENIEQHAWDGQWYRRAYFDNGEPLGSSVNPECRIDSLPQSWSVLSHAGSPARSRQALEQVSTELVDKNLSLIRLLDPPFDKSSLNPGYLKGYLPGVRENGGQYTHAAIWTVMAFAAQGDAAMAWELFQMINPIHHGDTAERIETYKVEPYVVAADVYSNPQHGGRGGWTWYTGSAAWMYRLITESLLGLTLEVNRLRLAPLLPDGWSSMEIHYRHRDTQHHILIRSTGSGSGKKVSRVVFDGQQQEELTIPLKEDGREHRVEVDLT